MNNDSEFMPAYGGTSAIKELPRAGEHQAVCAQVHSLGYQVYKNEVSLNPKGVFIFELDEMMTGGDMAGKPKVMSIRFAMYMGKSGKKSKLRDFLQCWRGATYTEEQAAKVNIKKLEGVGATLFIAHKPKDDGSGMRAEITNISRPRKDLPAVPRTYTETPEWVKKEKAQAVPPPGKPQQQAAPTAGGQAPQQEDDLPF